MYCSLASVTASCACTTSMLLATPAAKRSRDCVSCWRPARAPRVAVCSSSPVASQIEKGRAHVVVDLGPQVLDLGTAAAQLGIGLRCRRPCVRPPSKIGTSTAPVTLKVGSAVLRRQADGAVVGVEVHRGQHARPSAARARSTRPPAAAPARPGSRAARGTRARAPPRSVISGTGTVGSCVDQRELLPERQADHARQLQLGLLRTRSRPRSRADDRRSAAPRRARRRGRRRCRSAAGRLRLRVERLRGVELRPRRVGARRGGQRLQVEVGRRPAPPGRGRSGSAWRAAATLCDSARGAR